MLSAEKALVHMELNVRAASSMSAFVSIHSQYNSRWPLTLTMRAIWPYVLKVDSHKEWCPLDRGHVAYWENASEISMLK